MIPLWYDELEPSEADKLAGRTQTKYVLSGNGHPCACCGRVLVLLPQTQCSTCLSIKRWWRRLT